MPDETNKKSSISSTNCLTRTSQLRKWRENSIDPYLYVSFSLSNFLTAYGHENLATNYLPHDDPVQDIPVDAIQKYKSLLKQEWIMRAQLPIALLPENLSAKEIQEKNVVFIVGRKDFTEDKLKHAFGVTYYDQYEEENDYRLIVLTSRGLSTLTNADSYAFLHETGHAFLNLKHPKKYHVYDNPPFCQLDCTDTVMVYFQDCMPVVNAMTNIYYGNRNQSLPKKIDTLSIRTKETVEKTKQYFPTQLGSLDLEAAKEFNEKKKIEVKKFFTFDYLVETCISKPCEYLLTAFTDYALDVVNSCPTYFPPRDVTKHYQNQPYGLLFSPAPIHTPITPTNLIAPPSSLSITP